MLAASRRRKLRDPRTPEPVRAPRFSTEGVLFRGGAARRADNLIQPQAVSQADQVHKPEIDYAEQVSAGRVDIDPCIFGPIDFDGSHFEGGASRPDLWLPFRLTPASRGSTQEKGADSETSPPATGLCGTADAGSSLPPLTLVACRS